MGPPPDGALNLAAWQMIRDLVSSDPALNVAAWEALQGIVGLLPATGTDGGPSRTGTGGIPGVLMQARSSRITHRQRLWLPGRMTGACYD